MSVNFPQHQSNWRPALFAALIGVCLLISINATAEPSFAQKAFAVAAIGLIGKPDLNLDGKSFPWDCSGVVMAAMYQAGLDVSEEYGSYEGNGVNRLHEIAVHHQVEYDLPLPEIGDLIFWDNTWDKNEDLSWNDPLTHVGIVVDVQANGIIHYVHHDYKRGITQASMNLFFPENQFGILPDGTRVEINSPMRMSSQRYLNPGQWLSSQLFRGFGRLHQLLDQKIAFNTAAAATPSPAQ